MNEVAIFKQHILSRVAVTPNELEEIVAAFTLKKLKKKQFVIQPDFVAKYRNYVVTGALRAYVVDKDGADHTIQFAIDDWWISDINSYLYQKPSNMFVAAIEDSIVFQITIEKENELKSKYGVMETFFRIAAERAAAYHQRRIISALTLSAEERYSAFLENYPAIAQRLPQYVIASYLGMTTQFLSQIRNNKVQKK